MPFDPSNINNVIRDATLYRVLSFVGWTPLDTEAISNYRLQQLQDFLQRFDWMPTNEILPKRSEIAWVNRKLWEPWQEIDTNWSAHRFAQSTHEEIVILLGVSQKQTSTRQDDWVLTARTQWKSIFARENWQSDIALPHEANPTNRPHLTGQAWLWTGEWEVIPEQGWETLGREYYSRSGFAVFSWGLLGYHPSLNGDLPRFDLHTTIARHGDKQMRDSFLFQDLTVILKEFLKVHQYLKPNYEKILGPRLDSKEREVLNAAKLPPILSHKLDDAELSVLKLSDLLLDFSGALAELRSDARSAEIARDNITQLLAKSVPKIVEGSQGGFLIEPVDRLSRQMRSDLEYYKVAEEHGQSAFSAHQTLVGIEQARAENRLVVLGILLGTPLAVGSLLGDQVYLETRLIISIGGIFVALSMYWTWCTLTKK